MALPTATLTEFTKHDLSSIMGHIRSTQGGLTLIYEVKVSIGNGVGNTPSYPWGAIVAQIIDKREAACIEIDRHRHRFSRRHMRLSQTDRHQPATLACILCAWVLLWRFAWFKCGPPPGLRFLWRGGCGAELKQASVSMTQRAPWRNEKQGYWMLSSLRRIPRAAHTNNHIAVKLALINRLVPATANDACICSITFAFSRPARHRAIPTASYSLSPG